MMDRETVVIPDKKKRIEKLKKRLDPQNNSNLHSAKIASLEVTNKILKAATMAAGVITVIDIFIPDPILGLDEIALASITGLLKYSSSMVENKLEALAKNEDSTIQMEEITKLTEELTKAAASVKKSRARTQ